MRIGAQTNPLHKLDNELVNCAEDGFDYVEIVAGAPGAALETTDWNSLASQLKDLQLPAVCQAASYLPIANPSPLVRQAALDEMRRTLDAAAAIGAVRMSVPWSGWPTYMSEADGYLFVRQWLTILVRHGAAQNITVALINSPDNRHQLKYFREVFHRVPDLRFTYDIGHSNVGVPQSLTRDYLFALADRLEMVHMSDNDGSADQHLPLGAPQSGGIRLPQELRTLHTFRFDGDITLQVMGDRRWRIATKKILQETWAETAP